MNTIILLTSYVLATALLPSRAATSTNTAPAEGVTVETSGVKRDGIKETSVQRDARMTMECEKGSPGVAELQLHQVE